MNSLIIVPGRKTTFFTFHTHYLKWHLEQRRHKDEENDKKYFKFKLIESSVFCNYAGETYTTEIWEEILEIRDPLKEILAKRKEQKKMKHLFSVYIFASVLLDQFFSTTGFDEATAPGDIIIGGLFPIHESVDVTIGEDGRDTRTCNR